MPAVFRQESICCVCKHCTEALSESADGSHSDPAYAPAQRNWTMEFIQNYGINSNNFFQTYFALSESNFCIICCQNVVLK